MKLNPPRTQKFRHSHMLLKAGGDIVNVSSTIEAGSTLQLIAGGTISNTRPSALGETSWNTISGGGPGESTWLSVHRRETETGPAGLISAGGDLSADDLAHVTAPMLWYATQEIDGQQVLMPELILPPDVAAPISSCRATEPAARFTD